MPLIEMTGISRTFLAERQAPFAPRERVQAVSNVTLAIEPGQTLGLVGESGCGKSTLARIASGILAPSEGGVRYEGIEVSTRRQADRKRMARFAQLIFQDTSTALNPRIAIGPQIAEMLDIHGAEEPARRPDIARDALRAVGLGAEFYSRFPHQLSGGQRQRAVIARALVLRPRLVVCDEPVSALDVSVQAQVINLLADLREEFDLTYLFVSHDLSVVRHVSDTIAVMYLGKIVECAPRDILFESPEHPYTKALIDAIPIPDPRARRERTRLVGDPPSPINPPSGCRFHTRCPHAMDICATVEPRERQTGANHTVSCHLGDEASRRTG